VTGSLEVWAEESPEYIVPASTLLDGEKQNIYASGALAGQDTFCSYIAESPESYDSSSPYYRWTATLCTGDYEDATYGSIRDLTVTSRSANGYATGLSVTYDSGTVLLTGEFEIRTFLGRFLQLVELSDGTYRDNLSMLPSACFFVEKDGDTYTLPGGGFGHGIGMSQYAAGAMAQAGMDYREIIDFFYENVEIVKK
jgi:stage II sporulation protein D